MNEDDMQAVERRLNALEIKASYAEDLLDQLNITVYEQQQWIARLVQEVSQLRQQGSDGGTGAMRNLRDELPPHY